LKKSLSIDIILMISVKNKYVCRNDEDTAADLQNLLLGYTKEGKDLGFTDEVGIDLGTANVLVYIKGKGVVLNEPSVVAINRDTNEILAVGEEARQMLGRTPSNIIAVRPLRDGVISDYDVTERMLKYFIRKTCGNSRFFKPRIMVCVPSGVTEGDKKSCQGSCHTGGRKSCFSDGGTGCGRHRSWN
jgi:actin-like ATPase involved in cell morphogenesis